MRSVDEALRQCLDIPHDLLLHEADFSPIYVFENEDQFAVFSSESLESGSVELPEHKDCFAKLARIFAVAHGAHTVAFFSTSLAAQPTEFDGLSTAGDHEEERLLCWIEQRVGTLIEAASASAPIERVNHGPFTQFGKLRTVRQNPKTAHSWFARILDSAVPEDRMRERARQIVRELGYESVLTGPAIPR